MSQHLSWCRAQGEPDDAQCDCSLPEELPGEEATPEQLAEARALAHDFYNDDHNSLEVDDDARVTEAGDGSGTWITCRMWMSAKETP